MTSFFVEVLGSDIKYQPSKLVAVGRNYADHAAELNNPVPSEPLLFIKPSTSLVAMNQPLSLPQNLGEVHYETELALLIGERLTQVSPDEALSKVAAVGLALDLTLRDVQNQLKQQGHPWERAKAWDGSCPVSAFVPASQIEDWQELELSLKINSELRQQGKVKQMLFPLAELLSQISHSFTLLPGDLVLTGTPKGVGRLNSGDKLEASLKGLLEVKTQVS